MRRGASQEEPAIFFAFLGGADRNLSGRDRNPPWPRDKQHDPASQARRCARPCDGARVSRSKGPSREFTMATRTTRLRRMLDEGGSIILSATHRHGWQGPTARSPSRRREIYHCRASRAASHASPMKRALIIGDCFMATSRLTRARCASRSSFRRRCTDVKLEGGSLRWPARSRASSSAHRDWPHGPPESVQRWGIACRARRKGSRARSKGQGCRRAGDSPSCSGTQSNRQAHHRGNFDPTIGIGAGVTRRTSARQLRHSRPQPDLKPKS